MLKLFEYALLWYNIKLLSLLTRVEKAYPRKLARRAQLSPEEIQALTDEKRTSGTTTSGTTTQQLLINRPSGCTWIIVFLETEHTRIVSAKN